MSEYAVHYLFKTGEIELLEEVQRLLPTDIEQQPNDDYWVLSSTEDRENKYSAHIPFEDYTRAAEYCKEVGKVYATYDQAHPDSFLHVHRCFNHEEKEKEKDCKVVIDYDI